MYPHAKDVWSGKLRGTTQLTYRVQAKFPASGVIGWISYKLDAGGWEALTYDFLTPKHPSSQVQGWEQFIDATGPALQCVHQWLGDWKDSFGDIVRYTFRYRYPEGGAPDLVDLQVLAVYIPAFLAAQPHELTPEQMRAVLEQAQKRWNQKRVEELNEKLKAK